MAILAERAPRDDLGSRRKRVEQHEATRAFALTERRQTRHPHQERVAPVRALGAEEPHELLLEAIGEGRQGAVLDRVERLDDRRPARVGAQRQRPRERLQGGERGEQVAVPAREGIRELGVTLRGNIRRR